MRFDFHDGWVFAKTAGLSKVPEIGAKLCDGVSVGEDCSSTVMVTGGVVVLANLGYPI
jgi:hypothetical protein